MPRVIAFENLLRAYRKARRGKRDRAAVAAFSLNLESELVRLGRELETFTYHPGPYTHFTITDPKPRLISAAPFRDRVVHHALCNVIEPIFERRFIAHSFACRRGKGTHAALDACTALMREFPQVLQADVEKFFPSIDHAVLLRQFARVIKDPHVLRLVETIVRHGGTRGLPIGNQTSQFAGNVMLDVLDHHLTDRLRVSGYLRYCDDFLAFGRTRAELNAIQDAVADCLASLGLRLNARKTGIRRCRDGIDFLGFHVFPHRRRLRGSSKRRARRRLDGMRADFAAGRLEPERLTARVRAWIAHARHADTAGLRAALLSEAFQRASMAGPTAAPWGKP